MFTHILLRWLRTKFGIFESVIIAQVLAFEELQLYGLYSSSKTWYELKGKNKTKEIAVTKGKITKFL